MSRIATSAPRCLVPAFVSMLAAAGCVVLPPESAQAPAAEVENAALAAGEGETDLFATVGELTKALGGSEINAEWATRKPTVAILAPPHATLTIADPQLDAMLSEVESWLIAQRSVTVIARERQEDMIRESRRQAAPEYDRKKVARLGKQLGVSYFISGKISAHETEVSSGSVRYVMYLRVIEVETSALRWQERRTFLSSKWPVTSAGHALFAGGADPIAPVPEPGEGIAAAQVAPRVSRNSAALAGAPASLTGSAEATFSPAAARTSLATANGTARSCPSVGMPNESNAGVVFDTDGRVVTVLLEPPLRGSPAGDCVARHLRRARVPPYAGTRRIVHHTVLLD